MKYFNEEIENSLFHEFYLNLTDEELGGNEILIEIRLLMIEEAVKLLKEYPASIQYLINRNYSLARSSIERYDAFHSELIDMRRTLRSLLSGMIISSAISDENTIADYITKWATYDNNERSKYAFYFHHQVIYQQFQKVKTLEELAAFNEIFHQYLVEMAFKLAEIIIRRMSFTIEFLKNDEVLNESCCQVAVQLELFREEIEKLKKNPLLPK